MKTIEVQEGQTAILVLIAPDGTVSMRILRPHDADPMHNLSAIGALAVAQAQARSTLYGPVESVE